MNPERWQQIDQLFHSALERNGGERVAFLAQACLEDDRLRQEVESLLSFHDLATSFIEKPAGDAAAEFLSERNVRLTPGMMVNRYKILDLLGKGGMGEVYLAEDTELHRRIALKVLPAGFTRDSDRVRRFVREAHAASALNHPNIVTIHEIGRLDDVHFIVTEFIEGQTLREQFRGGMRLAEALDVAVQVASALAAAHAAGIVHRDIKPENIMLRRDGYVKVLDFGLAKLVEKQMPLQHREKEPAATNPGMVMGTVNYMSPEQARGLDVDARTDLWSLGVVLYEMVTGRVPFEGETTSHVVVSILESDPAQLKIHDELPPELKQIITKTLRKDSIERYQTARELAFDLKSLKQQLETDNRLLSHLRLDGSGRETAIRGDGPAVAKTIQRSTVNTADAAATLSPSSVEYLIGEIKRHKRGAVVMVAVVLMLVALAFLFFRKARHFAEREVAIESVAVLPFVNVNGDPNTEYLSDGISDSIINSLSQLPNLKVISLNAVSRYKGKQLDSHTIGREQNVQAVLIGRLTQLADSLTISVELVDVRDNRRLWGEQYSRKLSDLLVVQDEIAREVSEKLRLQLTGEEERLLATPHTENSEAYRLYLLGRYYSGKLTEAGWEKAIDYFEQAIKKDPAYAPAYLGLANAYGEIRGRASMPAEEARQKQAMLAQKQKAAVLKALQIDNTLAEAHVALAKVKLSYDWDWPAAERELKNALGLNPNSRDAHWAYAAHLDAMGRFAEAIVEIKRVQELDPLSLEVNAAVGMPFYFARQYDQAIEQFKKTIEMDPNFVPSHIRLGMAYAQKGMYEEAIAELSEARALDNAPQRWGRFAALAYVYALSGNTYEARKMLAELKDLAKERYIPPGNFALIYTGLGEKDLAFACLEKAYETNFVYPFIKVDPMFDSLRSDPRFTDLLRRMNLTS